MNELDLFAAALAVANSAERKAFLDRECTGNLALRERLAKLVEAHLQSHPLLDQPVPGGLGQTQAFIPSEQPGAVIAGRYKLLEEIGEGGMGTVWVAEQTEPVRRKVALKLIKAGMDSKSVLARFEAERQALAVMDHPNIAKVLDGGLSETGRPYFVMEYVKGVPITEYCDATRLSVQQRLNLFVQVCQAVQHAHQKGIIHRDLKPSNILVAPYDDLPVPKVIDFGLAKAMHQSLTEKTLHTAHESVLGTPLYMSPEQAQLNNIDVDTRSDIYSLGVLLYELLTGTTPLEKQRFKEAAWDEVKRIIREEEPPRPSMRISSATTLPSLAAGRQIEPAKLTRLVRGELDWIVMKSLEKDRARRYDTANGFAADVQHYLDGEPVLAVPPSAGYRLQKFVRRHKGQVIAASFVLFALLVGMAGTTWGLIRADQQRQVAEHAAAAELKAAQDALAQKTRAEAAEQRAKDEAAATRAVSDFLQNDLLRQASIMQQAQIVPITGEGSEFKIDPTIRELLDRAAAELAPDKIDAKFPNLPYVQAEVLKALGGGYMNMAPEKAVEALTRAVELYRKSRGPDDRSTLAARHVLGEAYNMDRKPLEAIRILEAVRDDRVRLLGPNDPATFETRNELGLAHLFHHGPAKAIPYLEQTQDDTRKTFGVDAPQTGMATFNLGCAYARAHRTKDALQEYEALYAQVKRLNVRSDHPYYHSVVQALGLAYRADGREAKAIPYLEESLQLIEKRKGPNPGALWSVRHHLGWAYLGAGRQSEAVKVFDANLKIAQPPQDVTSMEALGWAIREVDIDRAIALYEKTRALREERNDPKAIRVARSQVMVLRGALRLDESLALIDEILPKYEQQYGTEHVETLKAILERARTLSSLKRYDEAIALGADAAGRLEKTRGDTDAETLTAQSEWAKILERAGRNLEAAEVVSRVVAARRRTPGGRDTQLADALLAQGLNLHKGKRSADAEPLLRECMEIRMKEIPDSWTTASAKAWLGAALHDQGKVAEAEPLLIDGFTEMSQRIDTIPSWGKSLLRDPAQRLIAIYTAQNKPEEAAKWQKRLEAPLSDAGSSTSALPISPTK